ncbi:hypothetical protein [Mycolicibacterium fortuitum]|uniref:hypothetical protein n=1 Tax=Mycolicibacterium fortuitum TaxID=1766 RepID=UPI0007EB49AD|nr:hypothetical protein [Mycolicibacterium fortuitum]OBF77075.1 hypothetical protein A5751_23130 [Mycolicibacterium fortuitum]
MSAVLSRYARQIIASRGVKVADYIKFNTGGDTWHGDRCGCPDDRCSGGYHHDGGDDECSCLPAVLDQMLGEGVWAHLPKPT